MRSSFFYVALLVGAFTLPLLAREPWDEDAGVPPEVHYKRADKAVVRQAVELVRKVLSPNYKDSAHLLADVAVAGPFLWSRIHQIGPFAANPGETVDFKVSMPDRERMGHGRVLKDTASVVALEAELRQELAADKGFQVRKLHTDETRLLATLAPFDLEEPILMLESSHHRMVMVFIDGRVVMVDDLFKARLEDLRS